MFKQIGAPEIILILLVLVLLFGAKKLPDLSRSMGRSLRIFKAETKGLREEDETSSSTAPTAPRAVEGSIVEREEERSARTAKVPRTGTDR
jgi:sec-independent protein translocase protein TatA